MGLIVKSGQSSSSFPKCRATVLDRGAASWVHGLYPEQADPLLCYPLQTLPGPEAGLPRPSLRLGAEE